MNQLAQVLNPEYGLRVPCMLVLNVSEHTPSHPNGAPAPRIEEMRRGLLLLKQALCDQKAVSTRVQLAILHGTGPSQSAELLVDWTEAHSFEVPALRATCATPLAQGMRLALHHVDRQRTVLNQHGIPYLRPWIVLISDGQAPDVPETWARVAEECRAAEQARRCIIFPIALDGENREALQDLSTTRVASVTTADLGHCFNWLSTSLACMSQSRLGDAVKLPPTDKWATFPPH